MLKREIGTIWLVCSDSLISRDCVQRFEVAGTEVRPTKWGKGLVEMLRWLQDDDWILLDYEELQARGQEFSVVLKAAFQKAHVIAMTPKEVGARELHIGWVEVEKPINCATVCAVVEKLTGIRGCLQPGCCGKIQPAGH